MPPPSATAKLNEIDLRAWLADALTFVRPPGQTHSQGANSRAVGTLGRRCRS
jgi:hypothetical protein